MSASPAPVAQLDRASDYESEGRTFESFRAHQYIKGHPQGWPLMYWWGSVGAGFWSRSAAFAKRVAAVWFQINPGTILLFTDFA